MTILTFILPDTITRHENDDWFTFEYNENANQGSDEQDMITNAIDPVHYYNIWSSKQYHKMVGLLLDGIIFHWFIRR